MKEIKPFHITLYLLGLLLVLSPAVYFATDGGWDLGFTKINFITEENFFHPKKQEKKDITDILASVDTTMFEVDPLIKHLNGASGELGAPSGGKISAESTTELIMDEKAKKSLHALFSILSTVARKKEKISMLHYGDSQIEGDRMTNFIRNRVQSQFGGYGPGLIPANNVYNTFTFEQTYSENFTRYTCFGGEKLKIPKYGAMASVARFTPEYELDSIGTTALDSLEEVTGWIEIGPSTRSRYSRAREFNTVKMHYNGCVAATHLKVYQDDKIIHEEDLVVDGNQHTLLLSFTSTPQKLKYEFTGKVSPNICAFSLEGDYGVQVSNIGMRGSSGTVWGRMESVTAKAMYTELNAKLILMQFGGNAVPFFKDSADVQKFERRFRSQIFRVKKYNPGAMIIVIGPSDMSQLVDGIRETYPFLPYCVERMKEAAKATGSAYWDLYSAMGGQNSMPSWVEKGLAGQDYIHFSNAGAKFASELFYRAFIAEYAKWKKIK